MWPGNVEEHVGTGESQAMRGVKTKLCLKASTSCLDKRKKEGKKERQ